MSTHTKMGIRQTMFKISKESALAWAVLVSLCIMLYQCYSLLYNRFDSDQYSSQRAPRIFSEQSSLDEVPVSDNAKANGESQKYKNPITFTIKDDHRKDPKCQNILQNPQSAWRTVHPNDMFSAEEDYQRMSLAYECGGLLLMDEYLQTPPQTRLYPFEKEYLKDPPITNIQDSIDIKLTTVKILNKRPTFNIGDKVTILIQARDGRNQLKSKGGDEIRVWLKEEHKNGFNSRVNIPLIDLENGTYKAEAILPWAGRPRLVVALAYSREYLRAMAYLHQTVKGIKFVTGRFENNIASEATFCYHTPVLPGYAPHEICNLTALNGSPWFCGLPLKKSLSCNDHRFSRVADSPKRSLSPFTELEKTLRDKTIGKPRMKVISKDITFSVKSESGEQRLPTPKERCSSIAPQRTWTQRDPTGYLYNGIWYSFLCSGLPTTMQECLKNKYIVTLGDSNTRQHYDSLAKHISGCTPVLPRLTKKWHAPLKCINTVINTTISWNPHSQPFLSYTDRWTKDEDLVSSVHILDQLPLDGRQHWIILHHYIHLTVFHVSVYEAKYRAIKQAVQRLVARQPNVRVVLQSNHIAWSGWEDAGDLFGRFIPEIQKDVFKDLQDKVFFVPQWDRSIAMENQGFHPHYAPAITSTLLGFLCDR